MLSHERVICQFRKEKLFERKNPFKTCGIVLTDTLANKVYGLEVSRLSDSAKIESGAYPKFSKAIELVAKYAFWVSLAEVGALVSRHIGPEAGYTLTFAHPFIIGAAVKKAKDKSTPLMELKPSLPIFLASFGLMELAITPIFIGTINKIVHMAQTTVSPVIAATSVVVATATSVAVEYVGFRFLWKKFLLQGMMQGNLNDELKGFFAELNPLSILDSARSRNPAKSANEYVGQLYGIVESVYIWIQLAGIAVAVAAVQFHPVTPDDFIHQFFQRSAQWGKKFLEAIALAKCCALADNKIKENAESLVLGSKTEHS